MAPPRTLHIRCSTWEQVEAFYARKLRRGKLLSMRVPFQPVVGSELTLGLELPTHMVLTIDGMVRKCEASEGDAKHWIEIELVGLSDELLLGLRDMVADAAGRAQDGPAPEPERPAPRSPASPTMPLSPRAAAAQAAANPSSSLDVDVAPIGPSVASAGALAGAALATAPAMPVVGPGAVARAMTGAASAGAASAARGATPAAPAVVPAAVAAVAARQTSVSAVIAAAAALPEDERELFSALSTELRRLRQAAVHEVLGVSRDARAEEIRDGWMAHIRRFHPDVMARHRSLAVSHLAEELTILGNRAYDRLRVALVAEGRGAAFGPALFTPHGWLVGFDDLSTSDVPSARSLPASTRPPVNGALPGVGAAPSSPAPATSLADTGFDPVASVAAARPVEVFEAQARELLAGGDASGAREVLAAALVAYPRSRPMRSLYYVASALTALAAGQVVLATSQLETALAHHESCVEASLVLDQIHRNGGTDYEALRRVFQ